MSEEDAPVRSVTKSVSIDRPVGDVHGFLADAANWPQWAVINVLAIELSDDPGWWKIATADGHGEIRIHADRTTGIVDHDFRDESGAVWTVPARVVPNGRGSEFMMTFAQPAEMDNEEFDRQLAPVDEELAVLKTVLEGG